MHAPFSFLFCFACASPSIFRRPNSRLRRQRLLSSTLIAHDDGPMHMKIVSLVTLQQWQQPPLLSRIPPSGKRAAKTPPVSNTTCPLPLNQALDDSSPLCCWRVEPVERHALRTCAAHRLGTQSHAVRAALAIVESLLKVGRHHSHGHHLHKHGRRLGMRQEYHPVV